MLLRCLGRPAPFQIELLPADFAQYLVGQVQTRRPLPQRPEERRIETYHAGPAASYTALPRSGLCLEKMSPQDEGALCHGKMPSHEGHLGH